MNLKPGWSERQYRKVVKSIKQWPKWMRPNLQVRAMVEAGKAGDEESAGKERMKQIKKRSKLKLRPDSDFIGHEKMILSYFQQNPDMEPGGSFVGSVYYDGYRAGRRAEKRKQQGNG